MTVSDQGASRAGAAVSEAAAIAKTIAAALLIALVLRTGLFQPFIIPTASMEPGLQVGDYLVVSKYSYGWSWYSLPLGLPLFSGRVLGHGPQRGDVAVFMLPRDPKTAYVKRVIGLPGDRVQVTGGVVSVNGRAIPQAAAGTAADPDGRMVVRQARETLGRRTYLTFDRPGVHPGDDTGVYEVPPGRYFVMGDNRDNSADSRWPQSIGVGFVPAENLVGRAELVLLSWGPGAAIFKPWTWFLDVRPQRFFRPVR